MKNLAWLVVIPMTTALHARELPERDGFAMGGQDFMASIEGLRGSEREAAIFEEIIEGNIPKFLRENVKIPLEMTYRGQRITGHLLASPSFLAIGSDDDFVTIPMSLDTARQLALTLGFTLPTRKIVQEIAKLGHPVAPHLMTANQHMVSSKRYEQHHRLTFQSRAKLPLSELVYGFKKNLVLTPKLQSEPGKLALFGWRLPRGSWIQPLRLPHESHYVDYSHGVRMIAPFMWIEGEKVSLYEVAQHPVYHRLISDEGAFDLAATLKGPWLKGT